MHPFYLGLAAVYFYGIFHFFTLLAFPERFEKLRWDGVWEPGHWWEYVLCFTIAIAWPAVMALTIARQILFRIACWRIFG